MSFELHKTEQGSYYKSTRCNIQNRYLEYSGDSIGRLELIWMKCNVFSNLHREVLKKWRVKVEVKHLRSDLGLIFH